MSRSEKRRASADAREQNAQLRKAASAAESELKRLWQRRSEIDALLAQPDAGAGPSIAALMKTRAEIERQVEAAEQSWLEASEAAERVRAG